jgi:hypothetical protein
MCRLTSPELVALITVVCDAGGSSSADIEVKSTSSTAVGGVRYRQSCLNERVNATRYSLLCKATDSTCKELLLGNINVGLHSRANLQPVEPNSIVMLSVV